MSEFETPQPSGESTLLTPDLLKVRGAWSWRTFHIIAGIWCLIYVYLFIFSDLFKTTFGEFGPTARIVMIVATVVFYYYIMAFFIYGPVALVKKIVFKLRREISYVSLQTDKLQEELERDFFTNLVKINFKYLDKYYLQTQVQADKSFLLSAIAAFVGLLILGAGIALMFFGRTKPAYVTAAAGAFSEFIAAVFFYLYSKTVLEMGKYHQKLVLTQNIGLSLKISEGLPKQDRVEVQKSLIQSLTTDVNRYLTGESKN